MEVTWLRESIGKEPTEYWRSLFLYDICDENIVKKLAKAYSEFSEWITNNPDKEKHSDISFETDFNILFIVVVRRVIQLRPETKIVNVEDVYNYIVCYYRYYLDHYLSILKHGDMEYDVETQLSLDIVDSIINVLNEK